MVCTLFAEGRLTFWDCCSNFERAQELRINGVPGGSSIRNLRLFQMDTKYVVAAGSEDFVVWNRLQQTCVHHARTKKPVLGLQLGRYIPAELEAVAPSHRRIAQGSGGGGAQLSSLALLLHDDGSLQGVRLNTLEVVLNMDPSVVYSGIAEDLGPGWTATGVSCLEQAQGQQGSSAPSSHTALRLPPYSFFRVDDFSKLMCLLRSNGEMELRPLRGELLREARQRVQRSKLLGRLQTELYGDGGEGVEREAEESTLAEDFGAVGVVSGRGEMARGGDGGGYRRMYGGGRTGTESERGSEGGVVAPPASSATEESEAEKGSDALKVSLDASQVGDAFLAIVLLINWTF